MTDVCSFNVGCDLNKEKLPKKRKRELSEK